MFIAYWPVLGFVVGLVLVAVFTALLMAGRVCRARHETLPERPLSSYLPDTDQFDMDMENFDSNASDPMNHGGDVGPVNPEGPTYPQQFQQQQQGGLEGGAAGGMGAIQYSLDASMSPEGRREFGV